MCWKTERFGDVCTFVRGPFGGSLKKNIFKEDGYAVYEQQHAIYDQFTDIRYFVDEEKFSEMSRFELFSGDLIMSCSGTMGKIAIVPSGIPRGIINQALLKLTPKGDLSPKFLKFWMESRNFQEQIEFLSQGAAIKNMASVKILKEIRVPTPPLEEQKRIVAILDQVFADIDKARANAERNLQNARELFNSYLQQVFDEGGEGWKTVPLESLSNIVNGYAFKSGDFSPKNEVKSIKITNVGVYKFVEETSNFLPKEFTEEYKRYKAFEGDLVIALTRTIISSGLKVAVVPASYDGALVNQRVAVVQVNEQLLPKEILQAFLSTKIATDYVKANVSELMQPNLSIKDLKAFPVPVPPQDSLEEILKDIVLIKEATYRLSDVYFRKIEALDELKKSILQKAFTGELTKSKGIAS